MKRSKFNKKDLKKLVETDPDFVNLPKYNYSLRQFLKKHPNGTTDFNIIAKALMVKKEDVEDLYHSAVKQFRTKLNLMENGDTH